MTFKTNRKEFKIKTDLTSSFRTIAFSSFIWQRKDETYDFGIYSEHLLKAKNKIAESLSRWKRVFMCMFNLGPESTVMCVCVPTKLISLVSWTKE